MTRINIYAETLTDEVEIVSKTVDTFEGYRLLYGVRLYLSAPTDDDDDKRSALTFWAQPAPDGTQDFGTLHAVIQDLAEAVTVAAIDSRAWQK